MVRLVCAIAIGMVLGNLLWELLGAAVDYTGRIVTRRIIERVKEAAAAKSAEAPK